MQKGEQRACTWSTGRPSWTGCCTGTNTHVHLTSTRAARMDQAD